MVIEALGSVALQSGIVFFLAWLVFRIFPGVSPNVKAWVWRLAFLKPLIALIPLATVTLPVLAGAPTPVEVSPSIVLGGEAASPKVVIAPSIPDTSVNPWLFAWVAGVSVGVILGLASWGRTLRAARRSKSIQDGELREALDRWSAQAGVRRWIELRASSETVSAMLVGGLRPAILLPSSALDGEREDAELMLAHEVAHLARRDLGWFVAMWAVQVLFFFNPLVWVAARCARQAHESATDRYAADLADVSVQTYASMLLRSVVCGRPALVPGSLSFSESYRTIHQRLDAMKYFNSQPTKLRIAAASALVLGAACLMPNYLLAQAPPQSKAKGASTFNLKLTKADGREALRSLFMRGQKSFTLQPDVQGTVTLSLTNATFETALKNIVGQIQADYKIERGVYLVYSKRPGSMGTKPPVVPNARRSTTPPPDSLNPSFNHGVVRNGDVYTFEVQRFDVREILREVFQKAGVSFQIEAEVQGTVTMSVQNVTLDDVVTNLTRQVEATWRKEGSVYVVARPDSHVNRTADDRYDLRLTDCDVREALRILLRSANVSYSIAPDVQGTISVKASNMPFDLALKEILKPCRATYRIEGGVYQIFLPGA